MNIFKKKKDEAKQKRIAENNNLSSTIKKMLNEEEEEEGFIIEKSLIIEAWIKYRPSSKEGTPDKQEEGTPKNKDIAEIYGEQFM